MILSLCGLRMTLGLSSSRKSRSSKGRGFEPLVDVGRHRQLLAVLDARGGTKRGKPRARDLRKNPLGGRIFDMNCGWPMYRIPYGVARWVVQHGAELGRFLEQARALESRL